MKRIVLILVLSGISIVGFSQGAMDALRYTNIMHNGDARFMGMGGAFGALGGNISSFNYNPAGIGIYRKSDVSLTSTILKSENKSVYNGTSIMDSEEDFQVSSAGIVITNDYLNVRPRGDWRGWQIGMSYNMLHNFNNRILIGGSNNVNSIGDMYAALASGYTIEEIENDDANAFDLTPAWYSFLFNEVDGLPGSYISAAPPVAMEQSKLIESWGALNEVAITFGGNYADKLYIGATIGIPILEYHEIATYTETTEANISLDYYRSVLVKDYLETRGHGINLKVGMIYKANDMVRFGLALHTPTYYYDLYDDWKTRIRSDYDDETYTNDSPDGYYEYRLRTPMKAIASAAFVFGKFGLFSIDYEYLDYSSSRFDAPDYSFDNENDDIDDFFQATSNLRIGTEWKFMNFSFRGGLGFYGNPYKDNDSYGDKTMYTLGAGYRERSFYFDVAWTYTKSDNQYTLYGYNNVFTNPADIKNEITNLVFTFGVRF